MRAVKGSLDCKPRHWMVQPIPLSRGARIPRREFKRFARPGSNQQIGPNAVASGRAGSFAAASQSMTEDAPIFGAAATSDDARPDHPTMNGAKRILDRHGKELWAITCYFNPAGYRRRLANYRVFRERLAVPLVAVELAYGPNFELDQNDADILVQLRGHDVMWQKERLLNLALRALPRDCKNLVCLDCEIVFATTDWPEHVSRLLRRYAILQPFSHAHHLPRKWTLGNFQPAAAEFTRESAAYAIGSGLSPAACIRAVADGRYTYATG